MLAGALSPVSHKGLHYGWREKERERERERERDRQRQRQRAKL